jgi:hypothetical protein
VLESDRIKNEIFEFEHQLWEFWFEAYLMETGLTFNPVFFYDSVQ